MTDSQQIPDADERLRAIDPAFSFIVQAPAGSGKTGLLIQRYLRLLTCVDNPEEIVAITFTRKAAAEMRERILKALESASSNVVIPENSFEQLTHKLAVAALRRDRQAGWGIIDNPMRLRIQTIDSLCAALTLQMPILSKFGSQPETTENAQMLYLEAARATVGLLDQQHEIADDIELMLEYLDNDLARLESLLAAMLARRDHWLRHIHGTTRGELEASLNNVRRIAVDRVFSLLPQELHNELLVLVRYAAANLLAEQKASAITVCDGLDRLPDTVEAWCGIAELLLKADGEWRDKIDARQGFPAGKTKIEKEKAREWKVRITQFIIQLKANDLFYRALLEIRQLPLPVYTENQWEILGAITRLLPQAVAQLKIIFQLTGQVDFTEVSQSALVALGEPEQPTDLALALDYRIRHLLIDEFQDTSISQYQLIEKLVAAWEPGEGRSLFVVGDPMQSIYRFREAEVGLFLQARQSGIAHVDLQPITLSSNFRSQRGIVNWVNNTFSQVMPDFEDVATGAVAYSPSIAVSADLDGPAVTIHPAFDKDRSTEAMNVVEVIMQSRQRNPADSIAVLVRNRSHLNEIVACLQSADLSFHAVEIDALNRKSVVTDLLMLTRALLNPADRLAWLAVLRAPWCGLRLDDLQALVSEQKTDHFDQVMPKIKTVWEMISDDHCWHTLSRDGVERVQRISKVLKQCIQHRYRQSLRATVEAAWQALGGPGCIGINQKSISLNENQDEQGIRKRHDINSFKDAMTYFDYLEKHEIAGNIRDFAFFEGTLTKLYASTDFGADKSLQIMTIHKSKGLEFDTVLLPGLGFSPKNREKQLLKWMELPRRDRDAAKGGFAIREADLFLAPIQETGKKNDSINIWLDSLERAKEDFEAERLLYVAATRAKKFLHLLGHTHISEEDGELIVQQPRTGSLLRRLWPAIEQVFVDTARQNKLPGLQSGQCVDADEKHKAHLIDQSVSRLVSDWLPPTAPEPVDWKSTDFVTHLNEDIEFSWASEVAKHVGSIAHRWLQQIAEEKLKGWDVQRIHSMRRKIAYGLMKNGLTHEDEILEKAVDGVITALINSITDNCGRWILGEHQEAQNEVRLSGVIDDNVVDYVIDRTFCDAQKTRWIIDYKTSSHEGSGIQLFLDREQERYSHQLNNYAELFQRIDARPIRLGLYFPMLKGWRAWKY
ncbi:MAG: UvrD-helicase domain-containing protein [Burkholderiales bacterium]|nr:UvrD-helicase domain-containing protein [Nitrosomonas sp.]MCP5275333.1 UvrD-helicase domain-containing protein [Burkholderiales bacterium]